MVPSSLDKTTYIVSVSNRCAFSRVPLFQQDPAIGSCMGPEGLEPEPEIFGNKSILADSLEK